MLTVTFGAPPCVIPFSSMMKQADWIRAIAERKDRTAFSALFSCYAPRLRAYLRRSSLDDTIVEELIQDVMLTVWRQAASYKPERAAVSTWIFTIARNRRIDRLRKAARPEPEPDTPGVLPTAAASPDDAAAAARRAERLRAALETLPDEQAAILHRMYFDGASQREIAQEMDVPVGTIKSRVRLAMKRLREALAEEAR